MSFRDVRRGEASAFARSASADRRRGSLREPPNYAASSGRSAPRPGGGWSASPSTKRHRAWAAYGAYCAFVAVFLVAAAPLGAQTVEPLFSGETADPALAAPAADPRPFVVRSRLATVQLPALRRALAAPAAESFTLNLFEDASFAVTVERVEDSGFGPRTWTGHITDRPLSTVALTLYGDAVTGLITDGSALYEIGPAGGGVHRIDQSDMGAMLIDRDIAVPAPPGDLGDAVEAPTAPALASPAASSIDIFIYYSSGLRAAIGLSQVQSLIAQYVANANTAYQRSGVAGQLQVVGIAEIAAPEGAAAEGLLDDFANDLTVINQRNASNADLVALIVGSLQAPPGFLTCGIGHVGTTGSVNAAFSIAASDTQCVHTFAHEVGHNLGGQHAPQDPLIDPLGSADYPAYARGHKVQAGVNFRTIMAYECASGPSCPRVLNFSNPAVSESGQSTGILYERENALRLNELLPQVAAYRAGGPAPPPPGAPQNLQAFPNGLNVTLQWQPPASGGAPTNYVLVAGTAPGLANLGQASVGLATSVSSPLPAGTYFVRAFAQNGIGTSPASNEVSFTLGTAPPGPPRNLTASVNGNTLSLSWLPPNTGGAAGDYLLDAGTGPGLSNLATGLPIGSGTSFMASGLPNGTFFVRLRARNASGVSGPSNEVSFTIGAACVPPSAPQNFTATKNGFNLLLSWSPPAVGTPPFVYGLLAGSAPGGTNLFFGAIGSITSIGGAVPAGNYFVRVVAANACGVGPVSNEIGVTIP